MTEPTLYITLAAAALVALGMVSATLLAGWRGWLALQHQQLARGADYGQATLPSASARIEIADLKERIRKLEAIAAGVDL